MNKNRALLLTTSLLGLSLALASCATQQEHAAPAPKQVSAADNLCKPPVADTKRFLNEDLDALSLEDLTALAQDGNADAIVLLGLRYTSAPSANELEKAVSLSKAAALFRAAADKGQSHGEFLLGVAYMNGMGVSKDEAEAATWFTRSARRGNPAAQFWIGEMTAKGRGGITADWKVALPYFKDAAAGGTADAFLELGFMYAKGLGDLPQDYEEAATCYRQSVRMGSQIAQYNLRVLIADGHIARQDGDPVIKPGAGPGD